MSDEIRLSPQQRRLWLAGQDAGTVFGARCELMLDGSLDEAILRRVLAGLVARHEILRTTFETRPWLKVPVQVIGETAEIAWHPVDPSAASQGEWLLPRRGFDLPNGPVLSAALASVSADRHVLALELPALNADLRSLANVADEIERDYSSLREGAEVAADADEPLQYADYSEWQYELLLDQSPSALEGRAFWERQDLEPARALRLPQEREPRGDFSPEELTLDLGTDLRAAIDASARAAQSPPDAVLLAAWSVLLWRLSGPSEIVVGRIFDGRKYDDLKAGIGAYSRCLPVRMDADPRMRFRAAVAQVREAVREAYEWQGHCDGEESLRLTGGEPVSPYGFELEEIRPARPMGGLAVSIRRQSLWTERFRAKLSCFWGPDELTVNLGFDAAVLDPDAARRLGLQFVTLLRHATADPEIRLGDVDLVPPADVLLAHAFNDSGDTPPSPRCFHEIFAEQAARTPGATAVVFEEQALTYAELDQQANRLAHHLVSIGVAPEARVALLLERSLEMVVVLLATLKAGGAYVPLDPAFPQERLGALLEESGAAVVVGPASLLARLPAGRIPRVGLETDAEAISLQPAFAPRSGVGPENLAYVLFTSGSTGRPKGVAVEHRQLTHYLEAIVRELQPAEGDGFATVSTFGADLGNTVVFPSLATGGCLHVLSQDRISDADGVAEYFARHRIDFLKIVPSHLAALAAGGLERVMPRRVLVLGGEAASPDLVVRLQSLNSPAVLNHYGPTETTVGVATCRLDRREGDPSGRLPLGRPLAGCRIYLADSCRMPVSVGIPGEVSIGGPGVSRGYLGRADATAERFVPDAESGRQGARVYRTGDLAQMLPDGRLEFIGRIDQQIKIRGFRIEPGEIEAAMMRHPHVLEAVVLVREEKQGARRLAGFATLRPGRRLSAPELRAELARVLPDTLVPAYLTIVGTLPLTPNGKIDRRALLALEPDADEARRRDRVGPRNPTEALLAGIWQEVLGVEPVGIHDNFFELGGDSILVIQVIARAGRAGLRFNPRQLFQYQTIAELAPRAGALPAIVAEQGPVAGDVVLTPIQRWFFDLELTDPAHWNQAVVLEPKEPLLARWIEAALSALVAHHDALRSRFDRVEEEWRQRVVPDGSGLVFVRHDLSGLRGGTRDEAFARVVDGVQSGFDLARGPLIRAVWIDLGPDRGRRLFLAAHHLVVDGVSWRVILEDLTTALRQASRGEEILLPAKTSAFRQWALRLAGYAGSAEADREAGYWKAAAAPGPPLPRDFPAIEEANDEASARTVSVALDPAATDRLLHSLPRSCRAHINEILLSALLRTFEAWTGEKDLWLDLEGHGREPLFDEIDVSRTVGWFTTHFPVRLAAPAEADPAAALRSVKHQLRQIPGRGIGYGLLRYAGGAGADLLSAAPPELSFNYLGQVDALLSGSLFRRAKEAAGRTRASSGRRPYLLQVAGMVLDGRLQIDWIYSENRHRRETVEQLAEGFLRSLDELLEIAEPGKPVAWIASDFPLAKIGQEALDGLLKGPEIEDLYPLSPLQEGLLFHTLYEPGSGLYIGQLGCVLEGDLDVAALELAWRRIVERHPIFRTSFVWNGLDRPLQRVAPVADLSIERFDWSGVSGERLEALREGWLEADRTRGYDLASPPLMRIALCRRSDRSWELLWSHHHLLLDGWSVALLAQDLFDLYARLRAGLPIEPPKARPYRDYIEWLEGRDLEAARIFWQEALRGFTAPNSLERIRTGRAAQERQGLEELWVALDAAACERLEGWLRRHQLTLNTLVQGAWALLLSHYSGDQDVVFGSTVAGRPTDLSGFEWMVGLFINTLPVRVRVDPDAELLAWLTALQFAQVEARQLEHTPLVEIQGWSEVPRGMPLFESVLVVENYPTEDGSPERGFEIREMRYSMKENFPLIFTVMPGAELRIKIKYESALFSRVAMDRLGTFLRALLERLALGPVSDLRLVDLLAVLISADKDRLSAGDRKLKDLRAQKFEQVRRKAVPVAGGAGE